MRREFAIDQVLGALTVVVRIASTRDDAVELGHRLTDQGTDRSEKMRRIVDELNRLFVYAPDPVNESMGPVRFDPEGNNGMDVDDACLYVAALARSVGIPCRFIAARYEKYWTCFVSYERDDGTWETVDPFRQFKGRKPDEVQEGPL